MPSSYSSNLRIELINPGEQGNTWGNTTNTNLGTILDSSIAGSATLTSWITNVCTLSALYGANDQSRRMSLVVPAGSLTGAGTISVPSTALPSGSGGYGCGKVYVVINQDSYAVTIKTGSSTGVTIAAGTTRAVVFNGSDFVDASNSADKFYLSTAVTSGSADNQAATKAYVDSKAGSYLPLAGGSGNNMTGPLYLSGSAYVADAVAASQGFVNNKTLALASSTGSTSAVSGLIATGTFANNNLTLALAPATAANLGGVKVGSGITLAADGSISVSGGGGGGVTAITAGSNITTSGSTGNVTVGVTPGAFLTSSSLSGYATTSYVDNNFVYLGGDTMTGALTLSVSGTFPTLQTYQSSTYSSRYATVGYGQNAAFSVYGCVFNTVSPSFGGGAGSFDVWAVSQQNATYGSPIPRFSIGTGGSTNVYGNLNVFADTTTGTQAGNLVVAGTITAGTKPFRIPHPVVADKDLVHIAVESPRADMLYRGVVKLTDGYATVEIDANSNMTDGTFAAFTQNVEVVALCNKDGFTRVKASEVVQGTFHITAEDATCTDNIAWMVVAERADSFMKELNLTDINGRLMPEQDKLPVVDPILGA